MRSLSPLKNASSIASSMHHINRRCELWATDDEKLWKFNSLLCHFPLSTHKKASKVSSWKQIKWLPSTRAEASDAWMRREKWLECCYFIVDGGESATLKMVRTCTVPEHWNDWMKRIQKKCLKLFCVAIVQCQKMNVRLFVQTAAGLTVKTSRIFFVSSNLKPTQNR